MLQKHLTSSCDCSTFCISIWRRSASSTAEVLCSPPPSPRPPRSSWHELSTAWL